MSTGKNQELHGAASSSSPKVWLVSPNALQRITVIRQLGYREEFGSASMELLAAYSAAGVKRKGKKDRVLFYAQMMNAVDELLSELDFLVPYQTPKNS